MCTIAAYNGTRRAAPILIEMMGRLEGLDSGFYTGIATMHEGKIYYAKVAGDLEHLLRTTDALNLPGNIGFIHSRTPGKKKSDFAGVSHPFTTDIEGGGAKTALVLNGAGGIFADRIKAAIPSRAEEMERLGYTVKSRNPEVGNVPMPDGTIVHSNDVRCQMISHRIDNGQDPAEAMQDVFTEIPAECVSLVMSAQQPDAICFARQMMPMHVGFCDHGAYMSTAPLAFMDETSNYTLLPPMTYGKVFRNRFEASPFANPPATVAAITPQVMAAAYERVEQQLKTPVTFNDIELNSVIKPLYPKADCTQWATVKYQVVSELYRQGRLKMETRYIDGQAEGLKAPVFWLWIED